MINLIDNFAAIPSITVLCILAAQAVKVWTPLSNKHLPSLCGLLGCLLGALCFVFAPGFIPAENTLVAAAFGAVSGWAATGINQIKKQYEAE